MRPCLVALVPILASSLLASCTGVVERAKLTSSAPAESGTPAMLVAPNPGCTAPAVERGGRRSLALVVGVGAYRNPAIPRLQGPPNDARHMVELLTRTYGFPAENVCLLLDEQATLAGFRQMFQTALVDRARAGDVAVVYFAGHGSQTADLDGDEQDDGLDETWVLHDSRTVGVHDLVDDEVDRHLRELYARTHNITVILDSCNSGTATRGLGSSTVAARWLEPEDSSGPRPTSARGLGSQDLLSVQSMPEVAVLSAASDGTSALELGGRGVFTDALLEVLAAPGASPLLYSQVALRTPPLVAAHSQQVPSFQGQLEREVFGTSTRQRPPGWEVAAVGEVLELAGTPTPGMGQGAELRIYDPHLDPVAFGDPAAAKATVTIVDAHPGLRAKARITSLVNNAPPPAVGDVAVLIRPGNASLRISVRLRPKGEPGGLTPADAAAIQAAIERDPDTSSAVQVLAGPADFELSVSGTRLLLAGPEDTVRNRLDQGKPAAVARALWAHAQQKALKLIRSEPGSALVDESSLSIEVVPSQDQKTVCGVNNLRWWAKAAGKDEQLLPLCVEYQLKVSLAATAPGPMLVGGVILSSDGSTLGLPSNHSQQRVQPGGSVTFPNRFRAIPPLGVRDTVRLFATSLKNQVDWARLTVQVKERGELPGDAANSALQRALERYVGGQRGVESVDAPATVDDGAWTASTLALRVEANPDPRTVPQAPDGGVTPTTGAAATREYTVPSFDLRPYLPSDASSPLYKVLTYADGLVKRQVPYKQHAGWDEPARTDEQNLAVGIDCSRFVWLAFSRTGLGYNTGDRYLPTVEMAKQGSPMAERFVRCDPENAFLAGDVLVYRDDAHGDGHTVMVIDPRRRYAVGSQGFDGNGLEGLTPATGAEYQWIKYKKDWARWDRPGMTLRACWRHRALATQAAAGAALEGAALPEDLCKPPGCTTGRGP